MIKIIKKDNNCMKKNRYESLLTIKWAVKIALHINSKVLIFWVTLSIALAVLPALALNYYKEFLSILSEYLKSGSGTFSDVVLNIIILGLILTLSGLSGRVNGDLLYMVMYDYYHLGMQEMLMECVQGVDIKTLLEKEYHDEYNAVLERAGSLTDFMSAACLLISKFIGVISLLLIVINTSLMIFAISIIYIFMVIFFNLKLAGKARIDMIKIREAERRINYIQQLVSIPNVAKEIRIYNTKQDMYDQWESANKKLKVMNYKIEFWQEMISLLSSLGYYLFIISAMIYSIFQIKYGRMSIDVFLMLYLLGKSLSDVIYSMASTIQQADRGLFSLERQRRFILNFPQNDNSHYNNMDINQDINQESSNIVFEAQNVCFSYDDKEEILHNLNFNIKKGETIALVGCNGSGKSTLVKLLINLYKPTAGKLMLNGISYDSYPKDVISEEIGMFFQNYVIFHASMRENVGFGDVKNINNEEKILYAIDRGGATRILQSLKNGLEQWIQRDVFKDGTLLSGGEKQKLAISRSYMSEKDILIFDEPAAALDPIAEMEQFKTIKDKVFGKTAILISHRVGFARLADRIFVLNKGILAEVGTHEELIEKDGIYADFFKQQAEWYDISVKDDKTINK